MLKIIFRIQIKRHLEFRLLNWWKNFAAIVRQQGIEAQF